MELRALASASQRNVSSLGPQILRPHQRDGVLFLWKIVTGQAENMGEGYQTRHGAILADEMGASSSKRAAPPAPQCLDRYRCE